MSNIFPNLDDVDLDEYKYDTDSSEDEPALKFQLSRSQFDVACPNCWKSVSTFSQIKIQPNTIVFCDIDDTILHHPMLNYNWITLLYTFFTEKYVSTTTPPYDMSIPRKHYDEYIDTLLNTTHPMKHTDLDGFRKLAQSSAHFVFLTARSSAVLDKTVEDLQAIGVEPNAYPLHFSFRIPKGEYIVQNFDVTKYDYVVFIDDQINNLINAAQTVKHPGLQVYKYDHVKEHPYDYYPLPEGMHPNLRFNGEDVDMISYG